MRNSLKTLLFLSAFSPSLISLALAQYSACGFDQSELYYAALGSFGVAIGFIIMRMLRTLGETLSFTAKKIEATDSAMIAVVATYVVPFIAKASDITPKGVACIITLFAIILWVTSALIPHPALRLFRYRFYKVESSVGVVSTLITTRDLLDPTEITKVKRITNSMLVEVL